MDIQKHYSDFSEANLRESYIEDVLDRNRHIHNFISILFNIEKGGVIAIDGEWKNIFCSSSKMAFRLC